MKNGQILREDTLLQSRFLRLLRTAFLLISHICSLGSLLSKKQYLSHNEKPLINSGITHSHVCFKFLYKLSALYRSKRAVSSKGKVQVLFSLNRETTLKAAHSCALSVDVLTSQGKKRIRFQQRPAFRE